MFKIVMLVWLATGQVMVLSDQRGPHLTIDACETRRAEMMTAVMGLPLAMKIQSKCVRDGLPA